MILTMVIQAGRVDSSEAQKPTPACGGTPPNLLDSILDALF